MYHTCAYFGSAIAAGASNADFSFVSDTELRAQNNHLLLTTRFDLLAATLIGASVIRGRWQIPRWNFYGEPTIWSANRGATVPSNPQWDYWGELRPELPQNQEIQFQGSNNLGAATENEFGVIQLATKDWNRNVDRGPLNSGGLLFWSRATVTVTPTIGAWSGPQSLTLAQSLLGGTYALVSAIVQGTNSIAYRWVFPRNKLYNGYRMRPGDLVQNAVGDQPNQFIRPQYDKWGTMGYFNTVELPQIEFLGQAAVSTTYQVFMLLSYLSDALTDINRYTGATTTPQGY